MAITLVPPHAPSVGPALGAPRGALAWARRGARIRAKVLATALAPLLLFLYLGWSELPRVFWEVQLAGARRAAGTAAALLARNPSPARVHDAFDAAAGRLLYVSLTDAAGRALVTRAERASLLPPPAVAAARALDGERHNYRELWVVVPTSDGGRLTLAWSLDEESAAWYAARRAFTTLTLLVILVAAAVAIVVARRVTRPLERVTLALDGLTRSDRWDLRTRVPVASSDEVGELARVRS